MEAVKLVAEKNEYFREWIIEEWKHHNTVDPIYKLVIKKPTDIKFSRNERYFKIIYEQQEVGFMGIKVYQHQIYLYRLFIKEDYRNKGIGTKVLQLLTLMCKRDNKDLSLDVMSGNVLAKKLYNDLGFKEHYTHMVYKINDNPYENN